MITFKLLFLIFLRRSDLYSVHICPDIGHLYPGLHYKRIELYIIIKNKKKLYMLLFRWRREVHPDGKRNGMMGPPLSFMGRYSFFLYKL